LLGRLQPDRFPFPLSREQASRALSRLTEELRRDGHPLSEHEVATGALAIANAAMADAIRRVSLEQGHDVREDALVVFGGAGGQHATSVARLLGIRSVLFHPLSGVLSAHGIGLAEVGWHEQRDLGRPPLADQGLERAAAALLELEARARSELATENVVVRRKVDLTYAGTRTPCTVDFGD